jgi:hypothetical protein
LFGKWIEIIEKAFVVIFPPAPQKDWELKLGVMF